MNIMETITFNLDLTKIISNGLGMPFNKIKSILQLTLIPAPQKEREENSHRI